MTVGNIVLCGDKTFFKHLDDFNKHYKIHGDTGVNFINEYMSEA